MAGPRSNVTNPQRKKEPDFNEVMKIIRQHIISNKVPFMTWTDLETQLKSLGVKNTDRFFGRVCDEYTWGIDEKTGKREPWFEKARLGELKLIKTYLYFPLRMIELYERSSES